MSLSASKSHLNRDIAGENETIFDFLRRKKKYNLENTVNQSNHHSYTKKKNRCGYRSKASRYR
jgi:hypothetical protein